MMHELELSRVGIGPNEEVGRDAPGTAARIQDRPDDIREMVGRRHEVRGMTRLEQPSHRRQITLACPRAQQRCLGGIKTNHENACADITHAVCVSNSPSTVNPSRSAACFDDVRAGVCRGSGLNSESDRTRNETTTSDFAEHAPEYR